MAVLVNLKVKENRVSNYLQLGVHFDDLYKTGILLNLNSKTPYLIKMMLFLPI